MSLGLHIFVLFYLQYFVIYVQSEPFIKEHHLYFDGANFEHITSKDEDYNYPLQSHDPPLDIIWHCHKSIKLEIKYFELDGQNGDFLMISDVPLAAEDLEDVVPTDQEFIDAILVSKGLLLSWAVNQSIQVHSEHGSFIYFHAQPPTAEGNRTGLFRGFDITVFDFDDLRATTPRPTQEAERTTPSSGVQIYLTVFLSCNNPQEFVNKKDDFKANLAKIATKYCNETRYCDDTPVCDDDGQNCTVFKEFTIDEVSIPDRGMFYCDPKWPVSPNCVEVRFAIVRSLRNGEYIMTKPRLEEMWTKNMNDLKENGYCPYIPPSDEEFQVWVWVAFILGIILVLSGLFCVVWIKKSSEDYNRRVTSKRIKTTDDDKTEGIIGLSDQTNPIMKFVKKLRKGGEEANYAEMLSDSEGPRTRQNELYHSMHGEHDNHGYTEEVDVEFERPDPYPPTNRYSPVDLKMNITELQEGSDGEISV